MPDQLSGVNQGRIEWCCRDYGITSDELFDILGMSKRSVLAYKSGEPAFAFGQLEAIADFFSRGVLFFLEPGLPDYNKPHSPQFRTIANQKPELSQPIRALIERAERQREIFIALQEELGEEPLKPWSQRLPAELKQGSMKAMALGIRAWLKLDQAKTFDEYRAAVEDVGVLVFLSNGYAGDWKIPKSSKIRGFSLTHEIHPLVFVRKQRFPAPQTFTLFHELAHLVLHDSSFADDEDDFDQHEGKESQANNLAGLILLPDSRLRQLNPSVLSLENPPALIEELRGYRDAWGVSAELILRRLLEEGNVARKHYVTFRAWQSQNPIPESPPGGARHRHTEPMRIFGRPFVGRVLDALSADRVTLNKASSFLDNIKIADIHRLGTRYARV